MSIPNPFVPLKDGVAPGWWLDHDDRLIAKLDLDVLIECRAETFGIRQFFDTPEIKGPVPFQTNEMSDLDVNPTQLMFLHLHQDTEMSDTWFQNCFTHLFSTIKHFSKRYFGVEVFPEGFSPWKEGQFSDTFLELAVHMARPDVLGTWDSLLLDSRQKSSLITGIFAKALFDTVFSGLLFGASDEQMKLLQAHDEATIGLDGYKRTARRATLVRDLLKNDITTPMFWPQVTELATQMTSLFLPLINMQGHAAPDAEWPMLAEIHQQIFHIVSIAGYFSIVIRRSSTVMEYSYPPLGSEWLPYGQEDVRPDLYFQSRDAVVLQDDQQVDKAKADKIIAKERELVTQGQSSWMQRLFGGANFDKPEYVSPLRTAKVRIIMFPRVKRHRALCDPEKWNKWTTEQENNICPSKVIYYYGRQQDPLGLEEPLSLAEYRTGQPERVDRTPASLYLSLPCLLLLLLLLLVVSAMYHWQPRFFLNGRVALYAQEIFLFEKVKGAVWSTFEL